jgi:hypothetical protein
MSLDLLFDYLVLCCHGPLSILERCCGLRIPLKIDVDAPRTHTPYANHYRAGSGNGNGSNGHTFIGTASGRRYYREPHRPSICRYLFNVARGRFMWIASMFSSSNRLIAAIAAVIWLCAFFAFDIIAAIIDRLPEPSFVVQ